MQIEFYTKNNKLYRKNREQTIHTSQNDITLQFTLEENTIIGEEIYALIESPRVTYRLQLKKQDNLIYTCDFPKKLSHSTFFKISLYSIINEYHRWTTNILIIPLDRSGYMEYRPTHHPHPNSYINCKHNKGEQYKYYPDIYKYILEILKESINRIEFDNEKAYAYHEEKNEKELIQIIPLPNYITREELNNFMGDIITDIELDQETGELYKINGQLQLHE